MTFLKGLIITMIVAAVLFMLIMTYAILSVASEYDDQMGYDDEYERH